MSVDNAIATIKSQSKRLKSEQGRIARRNARRKLFSAIKKLRNTLDKEYPAIPKPKKRVDPVDAAAQKMHWREFEQRIIKNVNRSWDIRIAREFNAFYCKKIGIESKPIHFDFKEGTTRLWGQHTQDRIRLNRILSNSMRWRVLLHEIAHYRVHHHRRAFVLEFAEVYKSWREFLREKR